MDKRVDERWIFQYFISTLHKDKMKPNIYSVLGKTQSIILCLVLSLAFTNQVGSQATQDKEIVRYIEILKNDNGKGNENAVNSLAKIGEPAIPALINALGDPYQGCRCAAMNALVKIGKPSLPFLSKALVNPNNNVQLFAATALGRIYEEKDTHILLKMLEDKDEQIHIAGLRALSEMGWNAKNTVPIVTKGLKSSSKNIKNESADALAKIFITVQSRMSDLSLMELQERIDDAEKILKALEEEENKLENVYNDTSILKSKRSIQLSVDALKTKKSSLLFSQQTLDVLKENYWVLLIIISPVLYLGTLWLHPRWILLLPSELKIPKTDIKIPVGFLIVLKYRPRVLDAWTLRIRSIRTGKKLPRHPRPAKWVCNRFLADDRTQKRNLA
jgi:uncharacterized protein YdaT